MSQNRLSKLICGLSRGEVRNFNWFAQRQDGDHKYKLLFNLILEGATSDRQLAEKINVPESAFKVYKSQLKSLIIESLIFLYLRKNDLESRIVKGEIQKLKGLDKEAQRDLKTAQSQAESSESFGHWLNLVRSQSRTQVSATNYQWEWVNNRKVIEYLQLRNTRLQLAKGLGELNTPGPKISLIDSILRGTPILTNPDQIETIRGRAEYFKIMRITHIYRKEYEHGKRFAEKYIDLWENNPAIFQKEEAEYIQEVNLLAALFLIEENYLKGFHLLAKLREFKSESPEISNLVDYWIIRRKTLVAVDLGNENLYREVERYLAPRLNQLKGFLDDHKKQELFYNLGWLYTQFQDYSKAKSCIVEILRISPKNIRGNRLEFARILLLIIYFEEGDYLGVEYGLEQIRNFFQNSPPTFQLFTYAIKLFEDLLLNSEDYSKVFLTHHSRIIELKKDPFESRAFHNVDLDNWITTKINRIPWATVKKELATQKNLVVNKALTTYPKMGG